MPLGSNQLSYCYASNGKIINNSKPAQHQNDAYGTEDVISVLINRKANKPEFLKTNSTKN